MSVKRKRQAKDHNANIDRSPLERDPSIPKDTWDEWQRLVDWFPLDAADTDRVLTMLTLAYLQGMMQGGQKATDAALRIVAGKDKTGN